MNFFSEDKIKEMYIQNFEIQNGRKMTEEETEDMNAMINEGKKITDTFKNKLKNTKSEKERSNLTQEMMMDIIKRITDVVMKQE